MYAIVTGGSGFIGGHIVQELEARGYSVVILDKKAPHFYTQAEWIECDLREGISLPMNKSEIIVHAAGDLGASTTLSRTEHCFNTNILTMIKLMEWVTAEKELYNRESHIINCGLMRDWLNPYMISKHAASKIAATFRKEHGIKFLDARMAVVYGPRQTWENQKVVPRFCFKALRGEPLPIYGDGSSLISMMYVKNAVKILIDAAECDALFEPEHPGYIELADTDISVLDFAEIVRTLAFKMTNIAERSPLEFMAMRPGQPGNVGVTYDLTLAKQYLDLKFRSLEDGLIETLHWYKGCL